MNTRSSSMKTQPEALRLADALYSNDPQGLLSQAAAELRRLHKANTELLESLRITTNDLACVIENSEKDAAKDVRIMRARAAIAKATGGAV